MSDFERLPRTTRPLTDIPFVYESYRDLTTRLGAVDGHAASLAIAANFFADQSRQQANEQSLGLSLAQTYKISTRFIDLTNLPSHLHQLLIVGTTKHWEDFLTRFRREQKALGRVWRERHDGEDQLSHALDCIDDGRAANVARIGPERYALIQYYRLVRNATAHEFEKRSRLDQEFDRISQYRDLVLEEYGLRAPNSFVETTFDDHMLYTRVVKYVATDLCRLTPPRSLSEVHKVLTDRSAFSYNPFFIHYRKGEGTQLATKLSAFMKDRYNYHIDKDLLSEVVAWINGIPNKKYRKRNKLGLLTEQLAQTPTTSK